MRWLNRSVGAAIVVGIIFASACGSATGSTAVSVAGVEYLESDLRADLADEIVDGTAPAELTTQWLNNWILFTAIGLELESRGIVPTEAQIATARADLEANDPDFDPQDPGNTVLLEQQALRVAVLDWLSAEIPDAPPVEPDPDDPPDMLCSKHILVETEAEAIDVLARLADGEAFADLASEVSLDPGSAELGGELGCVVQGGLVPEFEAAAYAADAGEPVGPVQTAFGFHVIEVLSTGPATSEAHPDVDPEDIDAAIESHLSTSQAAAQSEVDTERGELFGEVQDATLLDYADSVEVASEYGTWDPAQFVLVGPGQPTEAG